MTIKGLAALFISTASVCFGSSIYTVTIDTSSQTGNSGAIYFQFAGGLNADPASVSITSFSIGGAGGLVSNPTPFSDGGVTGSLDSLPLTLDNSGALNDYEHYLTYGTNIVFKVSFNLPSVLTGNSGSELLWQLTSADGVTPILTVDPGGFIGDVSYDNKGVFTRDTLGNSGIETIAAVGAATPEPSTRWITMLSIGLLIVGSGRVYRNRSARNADL